MTEEQARKQLAEFLSIQAQDFIEELCAMPTQRHQSGFLSIQAQDFIEDTAP